jgi:hypothetical protein
MTPKQIEQRRQAGKARFQGMVRAALGAYPGNLDLAARHLTGQMRAHGFQYKRGVTREYMTGWAKRLDLA